MGVCVFHFILGPKGVRLIMRLQAQATSVPKQLPSLVGAKDLPPELPPRLSIVQEHGLVKPHRTHFSGP